MILGRQLIGWRSHRNLTQSVLARQSGLTQAYVARLESGQADPSLSVLQRLAMALGLTVGQLLEEAPQQLNLDRNAMDQLARSVFHPYSKKNRTSSTAQLLSRAFQQRRAALGLTRPRSTEKNVKKRPPSGEHAIRKLKALLGENQWKALLHRIDKHAPFQGST